MVHENKMNGCTVMFGSTVSVLEVYVSVSVLDDDNVVIDNPVLNIIPKPPPVLPQFCGM